MITLRRFFQILLPCSMIFCASACTHISLDKKQQSLQGPQQLPKSSPSGAQTAAPATDKSKPINLTGYWKFGYQFKNDTLQSSIHLDQKGTTFTGSGTDDQSNLEFDIQQGSLQGNQVTFMKKYTSGKSPAIQYTGEVQMVTEKEYTGPYMHGDYTTGSGGNIVTNVWEAELSPQGDAAPAPAPPPVQRPPQAFDSNPPPSGKPDLSGKWSAAYEYNFKTIKSIMFLEQVNDKITGHGLDENTNEKFTIDQGSYHYPNLVLTRKYGGFKAKKGKMVPPRTMVFKATVTMVNDKDYQGPYMIGKTQGGGRWEAQEVKMYRMN